MTATQYAVRHWLVRCLSHTATLEYLAGNERAEDLMELMSRFRLYGAPGRRSC